MLSQLIICQTGHGGETAMLECHDFRRIAAFTRRDELKGEGMELTDANAETLDKNNFEWYNKK
ncbi:MAG: hypothetical protein LBC82_05940 [Oscillospiraceae bacterium]|nr:hypothetical protein [Oscillospiraceae bacterium]